MSDKIIGVANTEHNATLNNLYPVADVMTRQGAPRIANLRWRRIEATESRSYYARGTEGVATQALAGSGGAGLLSGRQHPCSTDPAKAMSLGHPQGRNEREAWL
jgi:hypothetical protein